MKTVACQSEYDTYRLPSHSQLVHQLSPREPDTLSNSFPKKAQQSEKKDIDSFRASIRNFVDAAEAHKITNFSVPSICNDFSFQRRRFYDVLNVLDAVGCLKKSHVDRISWLGLSNIPQTMKKLQTQAGVSVASTTLKNIFPEEQHISIASLTKSYMLCFFALQSPCLNIKNVAMFLSKQNGRFKTTLCKLYQITHVLEATGVIQKNVVPGEVRLLPDYYALADIRQKEFDILSIDSLLNHHHIETPQIRDQRRSSFFAEMPQYISISPIEPCMFA